MAWEDFESDAREIEQTLNELGLHNEVAKIKDFQNASQILKRPAHKKIYLGTKGLMIAVIGDAFMITVGIHLISSFFAEDIPNPILRFFLGSLNPPSLKQSKE